jgi:nitroimidazol reductase NimA-like FMN-containing flavoprotein (pyridoxamine 5'-phosphate oxidase superfamily)
MSDRVPYTRQLDRAECLEILARNKVGRVAYSLKDRVDIEPIHYVLDGDWLYMRTSPGSKVATVAHNRWVAFEVDEFEELFRWRSVVVHGGIYPISADLSGVETHEHAIDSLRKLIPDSLTADDPVPFRNVVLRIHLNEVTGREAEPVG